MNYLHEHDGDDDDQKIWSLLYLQIILLYIRGKTINLAEEKVHYVSSYYVVTSSEIVALVAISVSGSNLCPY
jgi:hypothetical protein